VRIEKALFMNILITDITEMHAGNYCVAGWDINNRRLVRPLPGGANWTAGLLQRHGIVIGVTIRVMPSGQPAGEFPHTTEDTPIDAREIVQVAAGFGDWLGGSSPVPARTLSLAFGGHLQWNSEWDGIKQGVHVMAGAHCVSLVTLHGRKSGLQFRESFGKLKAIVHDGSESYQLPVSSLHLKEAWRLGGVAAATRATPERAILNLRLGLARPFPDKCYVMLNGVL